MTYTVEYKLSNQWFWRKIKNVKGDGIIEHSQSRFIILDDESRFEIPITAMFKFDSKRFLSIKQSMEEEIGSTVPVKQ